MLIEAPVSFGLPVPGSPRLRGQLSRESPQRVPRGLQQTPVRPPSGPKRLSRCSTRPPRGTQDAPGGHQEPPR
eukprot:8528313-Pyramimonas_sp.AAC.1